MRTKPFKILAIDDNPDNLIVLKALLKDSFPEAIFFSALTGNEGIELSLAERPDVVLLDIVMPGMDGFEVCLKLKAHDLLKNIPVLMITATHGAKENRIRALESGADGFLSKPVDDSELKAQLRAMLRIKESEDLKKLEKQHLEDMILDRTEALEIELADRKKAEKKLIHSLDKLTRSRLAILNLMEDLKAEVDERKQVDESLQLERNLLRTLIDNLPDTIYILDRDGKKVIANKADVRNIGCSKEAEVLGKNDLDLFPGEIGKRGHSDNLSVISSGTPIIDREELFPDQNGKQHWLLTSKYPLFDAHGHTNGLFGTGHDITDRKNASEELEMKNNELQFLNRIALELSQLAPTESIEKYLPSQLMAFSGAVLAASMEYNPEKRVLVIKHIETSHSILKSITKLLGKKILQTETPVSQEDYDLIVTEAFSISSSLTEITFGAVSELADKTIKSITGVDRFYAMANVVGGELFGTMMLGFREGTVAPRKELITSFSRIAAVSLQRRLAEEKLKESEERYRLLIQNQGEGIGIVDKEENFVFTNYAAEDMFGVPRGKLLNRNLREFVIPGQLPLIISETGKRSKNEKSTYELEIIRPNGERRTLLVTATPHYTQDNIHTGSFGVFRDITDRKMAEEALKESSLFNSSLLKTIPFGMDIVDEEGNILFMSENFEKVFGVQAIGRKCWDTYRDNKTQCSDCPLFAGITLGETSVYESHGVLGGRVFEINHTGMVFQGKNAMLEIFQDITDRKIMEEKIIESEAYYRTLIDISPDGILIADMEGNVKFGSKKILETFGVPAGTSVTGTSILNWVDPSYHRNVMERVIDIIKGNVAPETREYKLLRSDGTGFWGELSSSSLPDEFGNPSGLMVVCRDISDRKQFETELINSKEKAEESDRLKTAFLHNISHEIRTPMNAIIGFSSLLNEPDLEYDSQRSYVEIITQSSNHLLAIVSDIIEISNIEAGILKLSRNEFNLNSTLKSLQKEFEHNSVERNIALKLEKSLPDNLANIQADSAKLRQVFSNLLSNAFKFTSRGQIIFGYRLKNNLLEFYVSDTGIGIPEIQHARIFDRFYQVQHSVSRLYEGTGLGLSIAKAYIELMGGTIWLNSEENKGSEFYFNIPYVIASSTDLFEKTEVQTQKITLKPEKTILIAEDEENNFQLIVEYLSKLELNVIHAVNGKEAVDICESGQAVDIVLMDIKMPVMGGYEATEKIKKSRPGLPVIAQTAFAYDSDREKALKAGCDDYLPKPIKRDTLISMINKYIYC